jgi:hypothetical protein
LLLAHAARIGGARSGHARGAAAQGIEAEIPQGLRSKHEELERKARFFCPLAGQKNAPKIFF